MSKNMPSSKRPEKWRNHRRTDHAVVDVTTKLDECSYLNAVLLFDVAVADVAVVVGETRATDNQPSYV